MASSQKKTTPVALVMLALAMGGFAIGTTEFATMSLLPYFAADLGVDAPTAGHVISAYAFGVVVGAPLIAVIGSKLPRKTLLIGLMAVFAVANGLSSLAPDYNSMLAFRFVSGLPHGAYFGVAALVAASLVPAEKRAQAVSKVMAGLTIATVIGVPVANAIGQTVGWRWGFAIVAVLSALTMLLVSLYVPHDEAPKGSGPMRELAALGKRQVWLTLATGAVGFGGIFAVYTYLASTMMEVTKVSPAFIPLALAIFGIGMTVGTLAAAWCADRRLIATAAGMLIFSAFSQFSFYFAADHIWTLLPVIFLVGCGGGLGPVLQIRLMDVAGDAQTLAAALHHSAFNVANALGPLAGGMAIAAGYGWTSTGWVGSLMALGGLLILFISVADQRRQERRAPQR